MASLGLLAEQRHFVFPDDLTAGRILSHRAVSFVADQIIAGRQLAGQSGVGVWIGMLNLEMNLAAIVFRRD